MKELNNEIKELLSLYLNDEVVEELSAEIIDAVLGWYAGEMDIDMIDKEEAFINMYDLIDLCADQESLDGITELTQEGLALAIEEERYEDCEELKKVLEYIKNKK
jgi:hypothetical protein